MKLDELLLLKTSELSPSIEECAELTSKLMDSLLKQYGAKRVSLKLNLLDARNTVYESACLYLRYQIHDLYLLSHGIDVSKIKPKLTTKQLNLMTKNILDYTHIPINKKTFKFIQSGLKLINANKLESSWSNLYFILNNCALTKEEKQVVFILSIHVQSSLTSNRFVA
jgi:hypothetical protein